MQARQLSVFSLDAIKVRAAKFLFGQIACRGRASKHAGGKSSELAGVIHRMGGVFNSSSKSMGCAGGKKTFFFFFKDPLALNCKEAEDALVRLGLFGFAFARRLDIGHVVL